MSKTQAWSEDIMTILVNMDIEMHLCDEDGSGVTWQIISIQS